MANTKTVEKKPSKDKLKKVNTPSRPDLKKMLEYGDDSIAELDIIEAIRLRSGMYIEGVGAEALRKLLDEVLDNSCDEHKSDRCNEVDILLQLNGKNQPVVTIRDYGPGIPPNKVIPIHTKAHAGGKFGDAQGGKSQYGAGVAGLNGVGVTVVNALSSKFKVELWRPDGEYRYHEFHKGRHQPRLFKKDKKAKYIQNHGTQTTFTVEPFIYDASVEGPDLKSLHDSIFQKSCIYTNLKFNLRVTDGGKDVLNEVMYGNTMKDYLNKIDESPVKERLLDVTTVTTMPGKGTPIASIAFTYSTAYDTNIASFANAKSTPRGGTHLRGAEDALYEFYTQLDKLTNGTKAGDIKREDIKPGLSIVISAFLTGDEDASFKGQTKEEITNKSLRPACKEAMGKLLGSIDINIHKRILDQMKTNIKARKAGDAARSLIRAEKKTSSSLIGSVKRFDSYTPAIGKEYHKNALYIVEGDSAGGFIKKTRDKFTQGVYFLQGKIDNTHGKKTYKVLKSDVVHDLKVVIGIKTNEDGTYNYDKLKYHKIIIATDADSDGKHIETLLHTLWHEHFPGLLEMGCIYTAQPPLFRIKFGKKDVIYVRDKEEYDINMSDLIYNRGWRIKPDGLDTLDKHAFRSLRTALRMYWAYIEGHAIAYANTPQMIEDILYNDSIKKGKFVEYCDEDNYTRVDFTPDRVKKLSMLVKYMNFKFSKYAKKSTFPKFSIIDKDGETTFKSLTLVSLYEQLSKLVKVQEVTRFKGLGELNENETADLLMNPRKCIFKKLTFGGVTEESREVFTTLMGRRSEGRKELYRKRDNEDEDIVI